MPQITYIDTDGTEYARDVALERSVMVGARDSGVPHMKAECGGAAACATCKVRVPENWLTKVPAAEGLEASMLDDEDIAENIRLSCQIQVSPDIDGLTVHLVP